MMSNSSPCRVALAVATAWWLSGCSSLSGLDGTSSYGCKAPEGVKCLSVSGTYYNALQNNLPAQRQGLSGSSAPVPSAPAPAPARFHPAAVSTAGGPGAAGETYLAAPLRSSPKVLRMWIKPWEDADRDLNGESLIYVQVDNGRWMVDHVQRLAREQYTPVRPMKLPTSAAQAASEAGKTGAAQANEDGTSLAGALRALQSRAPVAADN